MNPPIEPMAEAAQAIRDEDLPALSRALGRSPLAQALGITFELFEPGRAQATLPPGVLLPNFLGYTHTGALFTLAEQVMAAAANSLGYFGLPLQCEMEFLKGADPSLVAEAEARVMDTQGRIARVQVVVRQGSHEVARLHEMVFLRSGAKA